MIEGSSPDVRGLADTGAVRTASQINGNHPERDYRIRLIG
jgi:hypothetical protein